VPRGSEAGKERFVSKPRYYFLDESQKVNLDFPSLGFDYVDCPYRFEAVFRHGIWRVRGLVESNQMGIPEGSQCLHYGQELFEGMKVQTGKDGKIYSFRPYDNARRMNEGAAYLEGPPVPEELFVRAIEEVAQANLPYIPPFGSGAALYVRPFYLGVGDNIGVKPAREYIFRVFVSPVGPYFKGGFGPDQGKSFMVSPFDRAAPHGTGHVKAGGNYACSFKPGAEAKKAGFAEALYLDPANRRFIEEIGAANFLGFKDGTLITPSSRSILPSLTRLSLIQIASDIFGWPTEERDIDLEELSSMESAACCGTAAVITWIKSISDGDRTWEFEFDPRWQQLYDKLTGIQTAKEDDPFGWRHEVPAE
jgi:branched-chain amino acid aminotransferase